MGTQLRQWAIRLLAAVALPVMLTLGLGVAANAQPVLASHVTSSTAHPVTQRDWKVYGPFASLLQMPSCPSERSAVVTRTARAIPTYHMDRVWYLYVQRGRMYPRHLKRQM